jgi:hypothetical protein
MKWSELKWKYQLTPWESAYISIGNGARRATIHRSTVYSTIGHGYIWLAILRRHSKYYNQPPCKPPSQFNAADVMAILAHEYDIEWV